MNEIELVRKMREAGLDLNAAETVELAKVVMLTETQIRKLLNLKLKIGESGKNGKHSLNPMVFFVTDVQKEKIDKAISSLSEQVKEEKSKAAKNAAALTVLAEYYLDHLSKVG
jgi:4-diphosphocytidyl-2C-methyl-D-erythritol kinase